MSKLLIKQGRVIDPANKIDTLGSVWIADGKVVSVIDQVDNFTPDKVIDASGYLVCPGFVDLSVRLREPGHTRKGTIVSETRAAAVGGVTSLCLPPDTNPVIDSPAVVEYIKDKAEFAGGAQIFPIAALTQRLAGKELSAMFALQQAGCIAVSNADAPLNDLQVLRRAMEYADSHGLLLIYRPNESSLSAGGCAHEGAVASRFGLPGMPSAAETVAVAQCLELAELTGCRVHFSRLSCKGSVIKIQQAIKYGLDVSADVAIHQLHFTEDDMQAFDSSYHVIPPFRSRDDRDYLIEGVMNGTIGAICSDHQPHDVDAKLGAFPETEAGISSLETLVPMLLTLGIDSDISLSNVIAAVTHKPADILGIAKGRLNPGDDADICIIDAQKSWQICSDNWISAGRNTPYWQETLRGKVVYTFLQGESIFQLDEG